MVVMSTGASWIAHGIHYGVLAVGVAGLVYLLAPRVAGGSTVAEGSHEARVRALRERFATTAPAPLLLQRATATERLLLPLAVVGSVAAAGVHAAVGPEHYQERVLFGLFFTVAAIAQVAWAVALTARPSATLLRLGAAGNLGVLVLWTVTRTVGLPFGLLPKPEEIGPWDISSGVWELTVVVACLALLRTGAHHWRMPAWRDWAVPARVWALGSALTLIVLSFSGAGS